MSFIVILIYMAKEHYQVNCLFCGFSKVVTEDFKLKDFNILPSEYGIFTIREALAGPGRGHKIKGHGGLRTIERISLSEGLRDPRFQHIAEQIRGRLIEIVKDYLENDIISIEDLQ